MVQDNISSNKIKENKYKILRMSLLLGNGEDREDTINNFEDASRDIDAMNDEIYLKDLEGKFYDTLTLEEEEKKLAVLVDYIGGRVEQRMSLLSDFSNVTGFELLNLPPIKYYDKLDEYKERLAYIREYLSNTKTINSLTMEISDLENKLNDAYVNKAKSEEKNLKDEKELLSKFESIIKKKDEFKDINVENASLKLDDIVVEVQDSKKSLEIFNKSFKTLNEAGINGEEEEEYLSYVNGAKDAYYNNKEQEYLIRLYIILNSAESEYSKILSKRDAINDLIYERIELRKELGLSSDDILSKIYNLLERQYEDIINQKDNIENIEYLNNEITRRKDMVNELEKDNQKVEILSLLKEFCIIDTYDTDDNSKEKEENEPSDIELSTKELVKDNEKLDKTEDIFKNNVNSNDTSHEVKIAPTSNLSPNSNISISKKEEDIPEVKEKVEVDLSDVKDNQVISITDATKINIEEATIKSNNVMKRVGEMLGVKVVKDSNLNTEKEKANSDNKVKESELTSNLNNNPVFDNNNNSNNNLSNNELDFSTNIFEKDFDADPEVKEESNINEAKMPQEENPLFNNNLANTTIDDVMANNNVDSLNNSNNDFWFSNEEAPMDLNSLPDISTDTNNNTFFGDNNNFMSDLEFPSLNMNFDDKEESHEN